MTDQLCPTCRAEHDRWLDARGPFGVGIRIESSGNPQHSVPTRKRTIETIRTQLALIVKGCTPEHLSS